MAETALQMVFQSEEGSRNPGEFRVEPPEQGVEYDDIYIYTGIYIYIYMMNMTHFAVEKHETCCLFVRPED